MNIETYIAIATVVLGLLLAVSFRMLPLENWQVMASVPTRKNEDGSWSGTNFTYYGFFCAGAYTVAVASFIFLLACTGVPAIGSVLLITGVLLCAAPGSSLIAYIVERRRGTFTVAGGLIAGAVALPLCVAVMNVLPLQIHLDLLTSLAAGMVSYTIGEGLGRLACISFGCCYGKPVDMMPARLRPILSKVSFVFRGDTKKIAYAGGLENVPVVPVQALSVIVLTLSGLLGLNLFLHSQIRSAFLFTLFVSQLWRFASEFLRFDFRGGGKISAYQIMSALVVAGGACVAFFLLRHAPVMIDIEVGGRSLFSVPVILALQFLWLSIFMYMGRSTVTGSSLRIFVHPEARP